VALVVTVAFFFVPTGLKHTIPKFIVGFTLVFGIGRAETLPGILTTGVVRGITDPNKGESFPIGAIFLAVARANAVKHRGITATRTAIFHVSHLKGPPFLGVKILNRNMPSTRN
jgi:hypothetical protein